jgi:hypothetical protein
MSITVNDNRTRRWTRPTFNLRSKMKFIFVLLAPTKCGIRRIMDPD